MRTLLAATAATLAVICALLLSACAGPQPIPPNPQPSTDPFAGAVADCSSVAVTSTRSETVPAVRACLLQAAPKSCLVGLLQGHVPDSIICTVVELGEATTAKRNAGTATADDERIAEEAAAWIAAERIGLK